MKQLVILSGKGGTGKTSVVAALAQLAAAERRLGLVDADVDAANLGLVLAPELRDKQPFMGGQVAVIDPDACLGCGLCRTVCRFDAVYRRDGAYLVDATACEGCASCIHQCPEGAIRAEMLQAGIWMRSATRFGPLVHAHLFAGQENSGKLVSLVKRQGHELAVREGRDLLLIDGPPGIGCPVIAAVTGTDMALVVTEPGMAGVHDLDRILATIRHFGVPASVTINKADVHPGQAAVLRERCAALGVEVVGELPYDEDVTQAMVHGQPVTAYRPDAPIAHALRETWAHVRRRLEAAEPRSDAIRLVE